MMLVEETGCAPQREIQNLTADNAQPNVEAGCALIEEALAKPTGAAGERKARRSRRSNSHRGVNYCE